MAITPSSIVRLCNVPIDNSYKNQIYFNTREEQTNYFIAKTVKTFSDYSYIRKDNKIGIRVDSHVDSLAICNYVMYQNSNYTNKYFYAFITELVYKNDNCTEIYFETDVYQTWCFEINVLDSFVVREHSVTDEIGDNIVPESFNFRDYKFLDITQHLGIPTFDEWGYLIGTTEALEMEGASRGKPMSGIYQGLYFYFYDYTSGGMNEFLDAVEEQGGDCVQFICVVPKFSVSGNEIGGTEEDKAKGRGWIYYSDSPASEPAIYNKPPFSSTIDGYAPKNAKCFTYPFYSLMVTNNAGTNNEYAFEYWAGNTMSFRYYGDVSANPSVMLIPLYYNGIPENIEESLSLSGFPQCAFNTDTFKLWLSRNQYTIGVNMAQGVFNTAFSAVTANTKAEKIGGAVNGAFGIAGQIADIAAHSKDPNKLHPGNAKNNLLTAMKRNRFDFYIKHLRSDHIRLVDDYFTMYGYKTDRVKRPNMNSRPFYNYVQTLDVNIIGAIPDNDMQRIKQMFNDGVTFWKTAATVGNYAVNNSVWGGVKTSE